MIVKNTFYIIFTFLQLFQNAGPSGIPPIRYQNGKKLAEFCGFFQLACLAYTTTESNYVVSYNYTCIADVCYWTATLGKQTKNEKKEFENPLSEVYSYMLRLSGLLSLFQRLSSQPNPENVAPRCGLTIWNRIK
jgi:hypothetical protein